MTAQLDLEPAARWLAQLVEAVPADALMRPTPCEKYNVGDLLDHIDGFAQALAAAAVKQPLDGGASGDGGRLGTDWRSRIPDRLLALAEAWRNPEAWTGMTGAGGAELPGEVVGVVALDELVVHGWDLARATNQDSTYDGPGLPAVHEAVTQFSANPVDGIFASPVAVAEDAPLMDRILGLAGRDPHWNGGTR